MEFFVNIITKIYIHGWKQFRKISLIGIPARKMQKYGDKKWFVAYLYLYPSHIHSSSKQTFTTCSTTIWSSICMNDVVSTFHCQKVQTKSWRNISKFINKWLYYKQPAGSSLSFWHVVLTPWISYYLRKYTGSSHDSSW